MPGLLLALCALPGLMGCGGNTPEADVGSDFTQVDSAGILISITKGGAAQALLTWTVDSEPDLVLGRGDAPSDYFHLIQGLRGADDGGVLVVDGGSQELRFYDSEGRLLKQVGGLGDGPGEFRDPFLVPVVGTDSLLIFDTRLPRSHVFSAEGELGRLIHYRSGRPYGGRAPVGAAGFRHLLFNASGSAGGPELPRPEQGMYQLRQRFMWYDTATAGLLTVDSVLVDWRLYAEPRDWAVPFAVRSSAATTASGAFITRGTPAEILDYDVDGGLRRVFRIEDYGRPVTQDMIDTFIDLEYSRQPARYGGLLRRSAWYRAYEEIGLPDTLPAFQALQVDELGWLWAEVYEFEPGRLSDWRAWVVFDPEGKAHGTVRVPPGLEVRWIGRDAVLGVWRDEFGVEYVHRYRLRR